jgi:uncharacterized glyoxalase superfamily protein PhnB
MTTTTIGTYPTMCPCLAYRDAPAAMAWLERAFAFETLLTVPGKDGRIDHAEMRFGAGAIMLGSEQPERRWYSPQALDGKTQSICVVVDDPDAHYARAKAAGAEIVDELQDTHYGSRGYTVLDLEGHMWHFATYRVNLNGYPDQS